MTGFRKRAGSTTGCRPGLSFRSMTGVITRVVTYYNLSDWVRQVS